MKSKPSTFSGLEDKLFLITNSDEVAGWLELLFLGEVEALKIRNSENSPIQIYANIPRDNFLNRIERIEELCPNEFYVLLDNKHAMLLRARMETEEGFKTIYGQEIEKYVKIDIDLQVSKEI